jgi:AcrR family transcriptional regulator
MGYGLMTARQGGTAIVARNKRGAETKALILESAARKFADQPYDTVSMDDLAKDIGVTKSLLFYYFPSKRDLYLAIIEQFANAMSDVIRIESDIPPRHMLAHLLDVYLDFAEQSEAAYRTLMSGGLGNDPVAAEFVRTHRARFRAHLVDIVTPDGVETPLLRTALEGFLSFMEGATLDWLGQRTFERSQLHALITAASATMTDAVLAVDPSARLRRINAG